MLADIREALPQLCWLVVLLRLVASLSAIWRAGGTTEPTIRHCWYLLWLQCTSVDPGACSRCSRCFLGAPASVTRLRESTGALQADSPAIPDLHGASNADTRVCKQPAAYSARAEDQPAAGRASKGRVCRPHWLGVRAPDVSSVNWQAGCHPPRSLCALPPAGPAVDYRNPVFVQQGPWQGRHKCRGGAEGGGRGCVLPCGASALVAGRDASAARMGLPCR